MERETAAEVIRKLEDAIDKVLEATATIGRISKPQFETCVGILAPTRLAIYLSLQAMYAAHPDLAPKDSSEEDVSGSAGFVRVALSSVDHALDTHSLEKVRRLFRDAYQLLGQAQTSLRPETTPAAPERTRGLPTLDDAAEALRRVLARLPSEPEALP